MANTPQFWYSQLHALALSIYQAQQRAEAAKSSGNVVQALAEVQNVRNLRAQFVLVATQFKASAAATDGTTLSALDTIILRSGEWVERFLTALPGTLSALPNAVLVAAGNIGAEAAKQSFRIIVPLLALALLLVFVIREADKSSTVRLAARKALA